MSNRLWAKHVKPPSLWKRIPLAIKVFLVLSLVIGGVYGAVQVIFTQNGLLHVIGTGFMVTVPSQPFSNMNITDPQTIFIKTQQNATWTILNTGKVSLSIRYFTDLPFNMTLLMLQTGQVDFQNKGLAPGASATGWFNTTIGHFNNQGDISFKLTIEGCYPVGLC